MKNALLFLMLLLFLTSCGGVYWTPSENKSFGRKKQLKKYKKRPGHAELHPATIHVLQLV